LSLIEAAIALPLVISFVLLVLAIGVQFSFWVPTSIAALVGVGFFIYVFMRFSFSPYFLMDNKESVWQSLRDSWRATKKRFWKIFASYLLILIIVIALSGGAIELSNLLPLIRQNDFWNAFISGLLASLLLPFLLVYVGKIYDRIAKR
jgi:membrane-anchored glycerophosphoryl diester phosphodiesterase (GDPDase)